MTSLPRNSVAGFRGTGLPAGVLLLVSRRAAASDSPTSPGTNPR